MKLKHYNFMILKIKFNQTAFYLAVKKGNIEIVQLLLANKDLDINIPYVLSNIYLYNLILSILIKLKYKIF